MTGSGDIFAVRMKFHGEAGFTDKFADLWANHMHAENAVIVGTRYDLYEAFAFMLQLGTAISREGKTSDFIWLTACLYLSLSLPDPSDFWTCIDDAWNDVVIDIASLTGQHLNACDTFIFGFVGKHGPMSDVANRPYTRCSGCKSFGRDEAALVKFYADRVQPKVANERFAADCHQHHVGFYRRYASVFEVFYFDRHTGDIDGRFS